MDLSVPTFWNRRQWAHVTVALAVVMWATASVLPGPTMVLGVFGLFYLLRRQVTLQEAMLGTFLFVTALASTRYAPNGFMRQVRLPLLAPLAWVGLRRFRTWPPELRRAHLRWLLVLLLVTVLPTFISSAWRRMDPQIILLPGGWFIFGTVMFHLTEAERTERFRMLAVLLPAVFLSIWAFAVLLPGPAMMGSRMRGWFGNPNELSHWWLAASTILVALVLRLKRRDLLWVLMLATFYLYLRSGSRTPLGGALVVFAGAWFFSRQTPAWLRTLAALAAAAALLVLPLFSVDQLSGILPDSLLRTESIDEGGGRFVAWQFGWAQLQERFWWGGGAGFEEAIYMRYGEYLSALNHQGLSHNSYLAFALNFGVVGAAVLAVSMWRKLGLTRPALFFLCALPFFASTFFEGVLTSPLNAITPIWFLAASLVSQELSE